MRYRIYWGVGDCYPLSGSLGKRHRWSLSLATSLLAKSEGVTSPKNDNPRSEAIPERGLKGVRRSRLNDEGGHNAGAPADLGSFLTP